MIHTSLAVLALSAAAAAAASPLSKMVHLHPHSTATDTRVSLTLHNSSSLFEDVNIGGQTYTIEANRAITVKAPAGTVVMAARSMGMHHQGDVLVELTASNNEQKINLR